MSEIVGQNPTVSNYVKSQAVPTLTVTTITSVTTTPAVITTAAVTKDVDLKLNKRETWSAFTSCLISSLVFGLKTPATLMACSIFGFYIMENAENFIRSFI